MANYAWMITRDFLADGEHITSEEGVIGPSDASDIQIQSLKSGLAGHYRFRMYDGDGELYYEGWIIFKYGLAGEVKIDARDGIPYPIVVAGIPEEGFGPLDDFGRPNAGCVEIRYFDKKGRLGAL